MLNSGIIDLAIGIHLRNHRRIRFRRHRDDRALPSACAARICCSACASSSTAETRPSCSATRKTDFENARKLVTGAPGTHEEPPSATGVLLGSPILSSQGMVGTLSTRNLTVEGAKTKVKASGNGNVDPIRLLRTWSRRKLPSYIPARSFAEAVIGMVIPDASGQTNMGEIHDAINRLPSLMGPMKDIAGVTGRERRGRHRQVPDVRRALVRRSHGPRVRLVQAAHRLDHPRGGSDPRLAAQHQRGHHRARTVRRQRHPLGGERGGDPRATLAPPPQARTAWRTWRSGCRTRPRPGVLLGWGSSRPAPCRREVQLVGAARDYHPGRRIALQILLPPSSASWPRSRRSSPGPSSGSAWWSSSTAC